MFYKNRITECQSKPRELWTVIGQLTGEKLFDNIPNDLSANDLNDYFSTIGSDTVSHLSRSNDDIDQDDALYWREFKWLSKFAFNDVSIDSVIKQLPALGQS